MWLSHRRSKPGADGLDALPELAEAYLMGRYAERIRLEGRPIPPWARLNTFAHGSLEDLQSALRPHSSVGAFLADPGQMSWASAQQVLARELLDLVIEDCQLLRRIQQSVLIPLELQLLASSDGDDLGPIDVIRAVRAALRSNIS